MAFTVKVLKNYGTIKQGRNEIRVQRISYNGKPAVYDIHVWSGDYALKGATLGTEGMKRLRDMLSAMFEHGELRDHSEAPKAVEGPKTTEIPKVDKVVEGPFKTEAPKVEPITKTTKSSKSVKAPVDSVVHGLSSLPVNDNNYPLKKATIEQIEEAIRIMEADKKGSHKTRLTRCKARLNSLRKDKASEVTTKVDKPEPEPKSTETTKVTASTKKADVIQFPKVDNEPVKKLAPSGEHHTYEEAKAKLEAELKRFKGDTDSEYVINGLMELANVDPEFCNNVMRPEKSYTGAMMYFANKARQGYCTRIGNIGIMSADTALKYSIDYFNSEEEKAEVPTKDTTAKAPKKVAKNAPRRTTRTSRGWKTRQ